MLTALLIYGALLTGCAFAAQSLPRGFRYSLATMHAGCAGVVFGAIVSLTPALLPATQSAVTPNEIVGAAFAHATIAILLSPFVTAYFRIRNAKST